MLEVERCLKQLRLSGVKSTLETRIIQSQASNLSFMETLSLILQDEMDRRRKGQIDRRYATSGLTEKLTLQEFDWNYNLKLPKKTCFELQTLKFIAGGENAIMIGRPGTGKSHIAKAIAYNAVLQGYRVHYIETDEFFGEYLLMQNAVTKKNLMRSIIDSDLLVLDDLFLSRHLPEGAADLLQSLVHKRYKLRRSIIVTSNRVVQDWGKYLGDNAMATTILDRLMHRSNMLEFDGKSYRLKEAAEKLAQKPRTS